MRPLLYLTALLAFPVISLAQSASVLMDIQVDVIYLASDHLEGRGTGSAGEALAAEYIADRFADLGLSPKGTDGWMQPFSFTFSTNPHAAPGTGTTYEGVNVVGYIDNGATNTVVVGAHFDHLGYGNSGSLSPEDSLIHNGADDNASGVAGMLEIARQLKASEAKQNNYLFIAFSGEEFGLFGSKYYVANPTVPVEQMTYMINLDMIGRLNAENTLVVSGTGTSPAWEPTLDAFADAGFQLKRHASGLGASDHTSFYLQDVPALHFFTGQHKQYHKPSDDSPLINFSGIETIASFIVDLVEHVDTPEALAFTKTKDEQQTRTRFKVSLGVMPDYTYEGEGLRIDAVLDDRPAANAGLEGGDIVVSIGNMEIKDVYAYMKALGELEPGDTALVVALRGEERVEKEVKF